MNTKKGIKENIVIETFLKKKEKRKTERYHYKNVSNDNNRKANKTS